MQPFAVAFVLDKGVYMSTLPIQENKKTFKQRLFRELKKNALVYVVLAPILLHFMIFQIIPFVISFFLTFFDYKIIGPSKFVGLKHWFYFFKDPIALRSLWNTVLFSAYYIFPTLALGLILALVINSDIKGAKYLKLIFFLPVVTSFVIIAGVWAWIFTGTEIGIVNYLLSFFGIGPQLFLSNSRQALFVLAGLSVFKVCGNTMIYYFAGLKSIDKQVYEAAKIDGASTLRTFWSITFPVLKPIHFYVLITTTIGSFQIFDSAYLLTSGGPNYSTTTLVFYLYQQGFTNLNLSYAAVISYILFSIILLISLIQRRYFNEK